MVCRAASLPPVARSCYPLRRGRPGTARKAGGPPQSAIAWRQRGLRCRCTTNGSAPEVDVEAEALGLQPSEAGALLQEWILENDGHIHPGLLVVENAPCGGGRGVVSLESISVEDAANQPLMLIPDALYLTSEVARCGFQHYEDLGAPPLAELDITTQLAVLLAHEYGEAEDSFYYPYMNTLPAQAPCAWAMTPDALDDALSKATSAAPNGQLTAADIQGWKAEVHRVREAMLTHSAGLFERHANFFKPKITSDVYFWALGMVLSRAFSTHPQLGLAPFVDLMNHRPGADHPEPVRVNADEDDDIFFYVTSSSGGYPIAMNPGDELCIQYIDDRTSPREAFLSYGFVPEELWEVTAT